MTGGEKSFDFAVDRLRTYKGMADFYNMRKVSERGHDIGRLPYSIKILVENAIRHSKTVRGAAEAANRLLEWPRSVGSGFPFMPYRVLLQDYTGVPLIVDLAAMRGAISKRGKDPAKIDSIAPVDLVIDHSVQVDSWGSALSFEYNIEREYERNSERYALLKWAQDSFKNMRVFPPGKGICHQVNLEYLSTVVAIGERDGRRYACPDTVVGTDSHTPMVNGLGVLGWGVGGIEAEAAMLGEPCHIPIPRVVGVKLKGDLQEGATTTDLVLAVTELLRRKNVVDAFVEYFGEGYWRLSVPDRATLGNMSPEYGATVGFSPVDRATMRYLYDTGRDEAHIKMVEEYCKLQGLFFTPDSPDPHYSEVVEVDLAKIEPSVAGPRNPEERRALRDLPALARALLSDQAKARSSAAPQTTVRSPEVDSVPLERQLLLQQERLAQSAEGLADGSVIIAAITSCTNTSNPTVMIGAALLARNAVLKGLAPKPFVKCSLAPGSSVVKDYLEGSGLLTFLDQLGFYLVGYGCTTCIGNSGPLSPAVEKAIAEKGLYVVAALSGNRNFDGRINPLAKGAFLMSPMLVVAYALVGRIDFDFFNEPLGFGKDDGKPVYLKDLWPSLREIKEVAERSLSRDL
jgi:aconitate hydratase A / 2-methylisocitrate dehydratase